MEMEPGDAYNPYKTQKPIPAKRKSLENFHKKNEVTYFSSLKLHLVGYF